MGHACVQYYINIQWNFHANERHINADNMNSTVCLLWRGCPLLKVLEQYEGIVGQGKHLICIANCFLMTESTLLYRFSCIFTCPHAHMYTQHTHVGVCRDIVRVYVGFYFVLSGFLTLQEICRFNCQELVRSVPFLAGASESFISSIITKLNFEVYLPRDVIITYGTVGHQMYFIQSGVVDVVTKDGFVITTLSDGSYFGGMHIHTVEPV